MTAAAPQPKRPHPFAVLGNGPDRFAPLRAISALILREMGSTYGRKPGGYIWAILEPLGAIALMAFIFSLVMRHPPIGTSFILFFATGYPPFQLYSGTAAKTQGALRYSRPLLAYPRVTWLDAILARFLLNALTAVTVMCLIWTAILSFANTHAIIDVVPILNGLMIALLIGLGVGLVNGVLIGIFPVWGSFWSILSRPLMLASGVLIMYESVPEWAQQILWWNPLIHVTSLVRSGFYATYDAAFVSLSYCYAVGLTLIAVGLMAMRAWHKTVLEQ